MTAKPVSPVFKFFFLKTTLGILVVFLLIISGGLAYRSQIKESYPDLKIPIALVTTEWPGAAPEFVEKQITNRLEERIKSLKGLKRYRSGSTNSVSLLLLEFQAEASLEESMQLLRGKVAEVASLLPKEAKKPVVEPLSLTDTPIVSFMLFGEQDAVVMDDIARRLESRLERIPGIKKVDTWGNRAEIVSVQLIPSRLIDLGISSTYVREKIQAANLDMPWGQFQNENFSASMKFTGMFRDIDSLRYLPIIRLQEGRLIRLKDIAQVRHSLEKNRVQTSFSVKGNEFQQCLSLEVFKLPGQDTITLINKAKAFMAAEARSAGWPPSLQYQVVGDESVLIWQDLKTIFNNGWQAMLAVFIVLLCMLSWREALIAALSIPLTFLAVLAILLSLGYTLNQLVIIGMVLALGLLVDDFILVMEGMHDGIARGYPLPEAQRFTIKTYAVPSFSGSVTTVLALLPLMMIGGIDGKFIRIIPVTAALCLTMSYLISIFVDVPLSRYLLKAEVTGTPKQSAVDRLTARISGHLSAWLRKHHVPTKSRALLWIVVTTGVFFGSFLLFQLLPVEMYAKEDGRDLGITVELPSGTSLEHTQELANHLGSLLQGKPYFEHVTKYAGMKSPLSLNATIEFLSEMTGENLAGFSCLFIPKNQRDKLAYEYLDDLRREVDAALRRYPGAIATFSPQLGGSSDEDPIQIELMGEDMGTLRQIAAEVRNALRQIPGTSDVRDTLGSPRTDMSFSPVREALDFHGISEEDLALQVRLATTADNIGRFPRPGTQHDLHIYLGMAWPSRQGRLGGPKRWEELELIPVITPAGKRVLAGSLLSDHITQEAVSILHRNGRRTATVLAKTLTRTAGEILQDFQPQLEHMRSTWPEGYDYTFAGEAEASQETYSKSGIALVAAICLVFGTLALLFDSFTQPFIIMFSVPFGLIGTFFGFFLAGIPISFPAMIGIISLVGITVNDAIVMIETMNLHRQNGLPVKDAAARGAADRLRPILSTSITTIVGLIPLALNSPGWMPLCNAIIFGLLASTVVSLFIIPCFFMLLTTEKLETPTGSKQVVQV